MTKLEIFNAAIEGAMFRHKAIRLNHFQIMKSDENTVTMQVMVRTERSTETHVGKIEVISFNKWNETQPRERLFEQFRSGDLELCEETEIKKFLSI